jgi:hypothetical protein
VGAGSRGGWERIGEDWGGWGKAGAGAGARVLLRWSANQVDRQLMTTCFLSVTYFS